VQFERRTEARAQARLLRPTPMNHSNNDGTSSAESEEGRLRIKENTLPFDTYPTPSGLRVSHGWECAANQ